MQVPRGSGSGRSRSKEQGGSKEQGPPPPKKKEKKRKRNNYLQGEKVFELLYSSSLHACNLK